MTKGRTVLLAAGASFVALTASAAAAQVTPADAPAQLGEIVVTGEA